MSTCPNTKSNVTPLVRAIDVIASLIIKARPIREQERNYIQSTALKILSVISSESFLML
jgi:hypothetical protein